MNSKKFLRAASAALMIVIVITLALATGAWAQSKYRTLYKFSGKDDGSSPQGSLIFDQTGNLYGTTNTGGAHGYGTVFKLTPNTDGSWTESVLYSFRANLAGYPYTGVIFDGAGNLYGTASSGGSEGGGAAFKLSPKPDGSWAYSEIHVFKGKPALHPFGGLVLGQAGTLYGTAGDCSSGCNGVVYEITP